MNIDEIMSTIDSTDLVLPQWRDAFREFIQSGEGPPEFLAYLDSDEQAQQAVEIAFRMDDAWLGKIIGGHFPEMEVRRRLQRWWKAHDAAKLNPQTLLGVKSAEEQERVSEICAERMVEVHDADSDLFDLAGRDWAVPPLVKLFFEAEEDKGCFKCWVSSNRHSQHPECKQKIARWFGYQEALMAYIYHVYILGQPQ